MCSRRGGAMKMRMLACLAGAMFLAGCVEQESAVEADFGSSVRAMIRAQTAPSPSNGPGLDGKKSQRAMEAYRENVSSPKEVSQDIVIRVGD